MVSLASKTTRKDFERISSNKYAIKNARYVKSELIICLKSKKCSCRPFMKFGICAELIAAQKLDLDLENRNLEEMLELQHQFAIKMKRGRHRLRKSSTKITHPKELEKSTI
jgi:hypothetical protein